MCMKSFLFCSIRLILQVFNFVRQPYFFQVEQLTMVTMVIEAIKVVTESTEGFSPNVAPRELQVRHYLYDTLNVQLESN